MYVWLRFALVLSSILQLSSLPLSSNTPQRGESAVHPRLPTARGSGHAQPSRHCPVRRDLGVRVCAFSSCSCSPLSHATHWPCRTLLQSSCDVNATNSAGQTPLHLACMLGADPTIVSMLIHAGCSLDTTDCEVCVCERVGVCVCVCIVGVVCGPGSLWFRWASILILLASFLDTFFSTQRLSGMLACTAISHMSCFSSGRQPKPTFPTRVA
jgi:hypothetical protein